MLSERTGERNNASQRWPTAAQLKTNQLPGLTGFQRVDIFLKEKTIIRLKNRKLADYIFYRLSAIKLARIRTYS